MHSEGLARRRWEKQRRSTVKHGDGMVKPRMAWRGHGTDGIALRSKGMVLNGETWQKAW